MDPAVDPALFVNFIPLNALKTESQHSLARKAVLHSVPAGEYLFRLGDPVEAAVFLVSGEIVLEDASGATVAHITSGETRSFHRIAHQAPRKVSARCPVATRVLAVDAALLDVMLTWDQSGRFEVAELSSQAPAPDGDWMTKLLQMKVFQLVPATNLQTMFMRMQEVAVEPGRVIVKQGDPGDYFYVIMEGRCMVTREGQSQKPVRLAELEAGSCFGEEALISEGERNASVTMLTRGRLMRLSRQDFRTLLNQPIARSISLEQGRQWVADGKAQWLDVRLPTEFQRFHLPGSVSLPLYMLRMKLASLDPKMSYIAVCDSGRRSSVAVFVLSQKGFDAYLLDKGLPPKMD